MKPRVLSGVLLVALLPSLGHAIVVADEKDPSKNLTDPGDIPWENIGHLNQNNGAGSSSVYLGNSWAITARHNLGARMQTFFNGVEYQPDWSINGGLGYETIGSSTGADLVMYRLQEEPKLPELAIYCEEIKEGTPIVAMGTGLHGINWDDNGTVPGSDDHYDVFRSYSGGIAATSWGTNEISGFHEIYAGGPDTNQYLWTDFDRFDATTFEMQAQNHDSGGGFFIKNSAGDYEIAGVIGLLSGPDFGTRNPDGTQYGDRTLALNLEPFKEEIAEIMKAPEPSSAIFSLIGLVALPLRRRRS